MSLKVKVCGITSLADAEKALEFGADTLGFNFYLPSPRWVAPDKARAIIEALPQARKRHQLEQWHRNVTGSIECLAWDADTGRCWGRLIADLKRKGLSMPIMDSLIAATAIQHGLIVATRNIDDFGRARVRVVNPFTLQT